jgi:uracil-DNA glycosylase
MSDASLLLARYLRQRREMGESELILQAPFEAPGLSEGRNPQPAASVDAPGARVEIGVARAVRTAAARAVAAPPLTIVRPGPLDTIRQQACACVSCGLAGTRTTVVFGEGDPVARLMVVGEAPGADEDRTGRPFVGRAGKLLDRLLLSIGLERESVYICNVLKCRPPGNRNPAPAEVAACRGFLQAQIESVRPAVLLALGTFSAQTLLENSEPISRLRGRVHRRGDVPLVPTYHPAAVLRNPGWGRSAWEDLQRVRSLLDG